VQSALLTVGTSRDGRERHGATPSESRNRTGRHLATSSGLERHRQVPPRRQTRSFAEPRPSCRAVLVCTLREMAEQDDNVPDELEEQLDDLAETLRDPGRSDRTIEDQGVERSDDEPEPGAESA